MTAASKEKVLDTLGEAASKLRGELGESLATVQKFDVPLEQATTSSLEALKAYSLGEKAVHEKGAAAALPYHQRAIELDPNFAMGYERSGRRLLRSRRDRAGQRVLHQGIRVAGTCQRTGKAGDHRRLLLECNRRIGQSGTDVSGADAELPARLPRTYCGLGNVYAEQGQYEKAVESYRQSLRLAPDNVGPYDRSCQQPALPYSASTKRGRSSMRRRRENWMATSCTTLSMLWPFSGRTPRRWRNSNSGLRASPITRT